MSLTAPEFTLAQSTVASLNSLLAAYDATYGGGSSFTERDAIVNQLRDAMPDNVRALARRLCSEQAEALRIQIDGAFTPFFTDATNKANAVAGTDALAGLLHQGQFIFDKGNDKSAARAVLRFFNTAIAAQT